MRGYSFLNEEEKIFIINNYQRMTLGRISEIIGKKRNTILYFYKRWLYKKTILIVR